MTATIIVLGTYLVLYILILGLGGWLMETVAAWAERRGWL